MWQIQAGFVRPEGSEELITPPIAHKVPPPPTPSARAHRPPTSAAAARELNPLWCCYPSQPPRDSVPARRVLNPTAIPINDEGLPTTQTNDEGLHRSGLPAHDMSDARQGQEHEQMRNDTLSFEKKGDDECLTMDEVASAWMEAISKINKASARAMCIPALAIAAGSSYDTPSCAQSFDSTAKGRDAGGSPAWGLWQIGAQDYDPDPIKQAEAVYKRYTSDHEMSGCLSSTCRQTNCGYAHEGIEQDATIVKHHVFCKGTWPAASAHYSERLSAIGEAAVAEVCAREASLLEALLKNTSVPFSEWAAAAKQPTA